MRIWPISIVLAFALLSACRMPSLSQGQVIIDWVDFIRWNGKSYESIYGLILADPSAIGKPVGKISFMLEGNVTNSNYKSKDGDAAFWPAGTELFAVADQPTSTMLAVSDANAINGYRLYVERSQFPKLPTDFATIPKERITAVEFYRLQSIPDLSAPIRLEKEDASSLVSLLEQSMGQPPYELARPAVGDPTYYDMAIYVGSTFGYRYTMGFDSNNYFWMPGNTVVLPNEFGRFVTDTK